MIYVWRYNLESSPRYDYMALEVIDSRLRLLVGKGSNAVELVPDKVKEILTWVKANDWTLPRDL